MILKVTQMFLFLITDTESRDMDKSQSEETFKMSLDNSIEEGIFYNVIESYLIIC